MHNQHFLGHQPCIFHRKMDPNYHGGLLVHKETNPEVLIVGGGIAGLSAAARLKQHGIKVLMQPGLFL